MAIRWAVTGGTWSSTSTWNDGATLGIPTSDDDVFTNNFNVTINQNINVNSLNNTARARTIATPQMTSNNSPSPYVAAASNENVGGANFAFRAFDRNNSSSWVTNNTVTSGWISMDFGSGVVIDGYYFLPTSQSQSARNWTFEGSNNNSTWTVLQTVTNASGVSSYAVSSIGNTTSYRYYRLNISVNGGAANIGIAEIELYQLGTASLSAGGSFLYTSGTTGTTIANSLGLVGTSFLFISNGGTQNITYTSATNTNRLLNINSTNSNTTLTGPTPTLDAAIVYTAGGTLTYNGNISTTAGASSAIITMVANATLTVNGNVNGGGPTARGILVPTGAATINIIGNVTGGGGVGGSAILSQGTATFNITGNLVGGGGGNAIQLQAAPSSINVTGNITGGALSAIGGVFNYPINVTGVINGGSGANGIDHSGTINIIGNVNASSTFNGISSTGVVNLTGNMLNFNGEQAIWCPRVFISNSSTTQWRLFDNAGNNKTLYSTDTFPNLPSIGDVRNGSVYGPASGLTGTLRMAIPSDVRINVPTDNTVGSATLTSEDLFNAILSGSTNPVAIRLRNISTVQTTGDQISSYN
jgi:hypothetical protein